MCSPGVAGIVHILTLLRGNRMVPNSASPTGGCFVIVIVFVPSRESPSSLGNTREVK